MYNDITNNEICPGILQINSDIQCCVLAGGVAAICASEQLPSIAGSLKQRRGVFCVIDLQ